MKKLIFLLASVFLYTISNAQISCSGSSVGTVYLNKNFSDSSITSGGWTTQVVVGTSDWTTDVFSGDTFAKITNFSGGVNTASESWLISPSINLTGSAFPTLNFQNVANYNGAPMELYVSTNYPGTGDPNTNGTWTNLTSLVNWDTDLAAWGTFLCSADADLTSYISSTTYIAFKYTGSNVDGSTQEIDDIIVFENAGSSVVATCSGTTATSLYLHKNFADSSVTSGGWTTQLVTGTRDWVPDVFGGDTFAVMSNFSGGANSLSETWLISPAVDLSSSNTPILNFQNIANYAGSPLELWVSTDYPGTGNPNSNGTWTNLTASANWDLNLTAWGSWICSGDINLSSYKSVTTYIAYKYTGSATDGSTQEIDDIMIYETASGPISVSITAIQTPGGGSDSSTYTGQTVQTSGVVTAVGSIGYWIQNPGGGPYSGVFVYDNINFPVIGDLVDITGDVDEYNNLTEITNVSAFTITSSGNSYSVTNLSTNAVNDEQYEGVMIRVLNATCNTSINGFGEWIVNDGTGDVQIDDPLFAYVPTVGTDYSVTGVVGYSFGSYEVFPRFAADIDSTVLPPFVTITNIQTPGGGSDSSLYKGDTVMTTGVVTAVGSLGYWLQLPGGGAYSGIFVYDNINFPTIGDNVDVTGEVDEYNGLTEITNVSSFNITSSGNSYTITPLSTNAVNDEMYEGVMVQVMGATCTVSINGFNEWFIDDGSGSLQIDDPLFMYNPTVGVDYDVTGVVGYSFGSFELFPRFAADIDSTITSAGPINLSIVTIQTPGGGSDSSLYNGDSVITGGIVTAVKAGTGYWIQESNGGPYSGIYVYDAINTPTEGDSVTLTAVVDEFNGLTELTNVSSFNLVSSSNSYVITSLSTLAVNDEQYESVMVAVTNAICNSAPNGFGEWIINDGSGNVMIDDFIYPYGATVPTIYDVTGVVFYNFGNFKIEPRYQADIDSSGTGVLIGDTVSITAIQTPNGGTGDSPYLDSTVTTNGIVTAVKAGTGYWIQKSTGGPYSGVYVFDGANTPSEGDSVIITGMVDEFFGLTEITSVSAFSVISSSNSFVITDLSTNNVNDEQYEGVMVKVLGATCTIDTNQFAEWYVDDNSGPAQIDDFMYTYDPTVGKKYNVTGPVGYSFSNYEILPRYTADVELINDSIVDPGDTNSIYEVERLILNIYPNPFNGFVNIDLGQRSNALITVIDITGQKMMQTGTNKMITTLDMNNLDSGIYFIEITSNDLVEIRKVIKK